MVKDEVASFSLVKIVGISFILMFCSTIGAMAFSDTVKDENIMSEDILNSYMNITEKLEAVVEEIPFETVTKEVAGGTNKVVQQGQNGEKTTIYKVKYMDEEEIYRQEISSEITKKPINKIIEVKKTTSRAGTNTRTTNTDGQYVRFTATGYCPCVKCCGKSSGITASGAKATAGVTVAMSKSYAFGTKVEIKGMGTYTVQDRGGAISGNKVDIFFATHQEAINFGRRTVEVQVH